MLGDLPLDLQESVLAELPKPGKTELPKTCLAQILRVDALHLDWRDRPKKEPSRMRRSPWGYPTKSDETIAVIVAFSSSTNVDRLANTPRVVERLVRLRYSAVGPVVTEYRKFESFDLRPLRVARNGVAGDHHYVRVRGR